MKEHLVEERVFRAKKRMMVFTSYEPICEKVKEYSGMEEQVAELISRTQKETKGLYNIMLQDVTDGIKNMIESDND